MTESPSTPPSPPDPSRRRLLLGLGSAPVIVSLTSKPALAASCLTISATASLTADPMTSAAHGLDSCMGGSPSSWLNRGSLNDLFGNTNGPTFVSIFGFLWGSGWSLQTRFRDVLGMSSGDDPQQFGGNMVAAYCNATKYPSYYPLTTGQVVQIAQAIKYHGVYVVPATDELWGADQVKQFLSQTYTL